MERFGPSRTTRELAKGAQGVVLEASSQGQPCALARSSGPVARIQERALREAPWPLVERYLVRPAPAPPPREPWPSARLKSAIQGGEITRLSAIVATVAW